MISILAFRRSQQTGHQLEKLVVHMILLGLVKRGGPYDGSGSRGVAGQATAARTSGASPFKSAREPTWSRCQNLCTEAAAWPAGSVCLLHRNVCRCQDPLQSSSFSSFSSSSSLSSPLSSSLSSSSASSSSGTSTSFNGASGSTPSSLDMSL